MESAFHGAASIGIIGGSDGPTSVFIGTKGRGYSVPNDVRGLARAISRTAAAFGILLVLVIHRRRTVKKDM